LPLSSAIQVVMSVSPHIQYYLPTLTRYPGQWVSLTL
jgi:hypothetical protein